LGKIILLSRSVARRRATSCYRILVRRVNRPLCIYLLALVVLESFVAVADVVAQNPIARVLFAADVATVPSSDCRVAMDFGSVELRPILSLKKILSPK
jgi:hypothetical protein